jgi:protocatechuate 3,4-dioxygenase beta subunit
MTQANNTRRRIVAATGAALGLSSFTGRALGKGQLRPTPVQEEGPFYPVSFSGDVDYDLLTTGALHYSQGQPTWLSGVVTDPDGAPVKGAMIEIWQADQHGHYHHPRDRGGADPAFQGFARIAVDASGQYRFHTIRPVPYTGRTPHIHFRIKLGPRELLTTQLYVAGDPGNPGDFIWSSLSEQDRAAVTRPFERGPDGMMARFPIVVEA